jgi:hypothetical protein
MAPATVSAVVLLTVWSVCITVWLMIISANEVYKWEDCRTEEESQQPFTSTSLSFKPHSHEDVVIADRLLKYYSQIFYWPDIGFEKCTLVLLVWHRAALHSLLRHYCSIGVFQRILVVWNNVTTPVHAIGRSVCKIEVIIVKSSTDKLTNRYLAWKEIQTDCECQHGWSACTAITEYTLWPCRCVPCR